MSTYEYRNDLMNGSALDDDGTMTQHCGPTRSTLWVRVLEVAGKPRMLVIVALGVAGVFYSTFG